jgi:CRP/FNR family cyclic AMP-dependent transcriptional regulator
MLSILKQVPLFQNLTDDQLNKLSGIYIRRTFPEGTILFREKEPGDIFYIVVKGSVKIYTSSAGEEKVLSVFEDGDNFGELSLIDGKPRSASAQVLKNSTFLTIRSIDFIQLLKENCDISMGVMLELCRRLRDTNDHVYDLTFLDPRHRIVKTLILFANKNGIRTGNMVTIKMALNYDELARMSGVTKSTLMQVIRDMERVKLLIPIPEGFTIDLSKLQSL